MKKFKRSLSLILALIMVVSFAPMAFASEATPAPEGGTAPAFTPNIDNDNTDVIYVTYTIERAGTFGDASFAKTFTDSSPTFGLNLTNEKFLNGTDTTPDFTYAGYSVDGGGKWKKGAFDTKALTGLLKKGGTLWLASVLDSKGKEPEVGAAEKPESEAGKGDGTAQVTSATIVKFAPIEAAPKKPAFKINYGLENFRDDTGDSTGTWTLSDKADMTKVTPDIGSLLVAWCKEGKTPVKLYGTEGDDSTAYEYGKFPVDGIEVAPTTGDKVGKQNYVVRYTATLKDGKYTPGSATAKVTASDQIKAPNLKPDYKKEIIKMKAGMMLQFAGSTDARVAYASTGYAVPEIGGDILVKLTDKDNAKAPVLLKDYLTEEQKQIEAFFIASEKKPASKHQVIKLATRALLKDVTFTPDKGKVKADKSLEFYDTAKKKYGGFPKVSASYTGKGRLKSTAKVTKTGVTGNAASADGDLTVTWGKYVVKTSEKDGIIAAELIGKDYHNGDYVAYLSATSDTTVKDANATTTLTFGIKNVPNDVSDATPSSFTITASGTSFNATITSLTTPSGTFKGLTLPSFTVNNVPVGPVKVSYRPEGAAADTTIYTGEVKVEPNDVEKVAIASGLIASITSLEARDAAGAKTVVEEAIADLELTGTTYKLEGLTTTASAAVAASGGWTVKVKVQSGTENTEVTVTVAETASFNLTITVATGTSIESVTNGLTTPVTATSPGVYKIYKDAGVNITITKASGTWKAEPSIGANSTDIISSIPEATASITGGKLVIVLPKEEVAELSGAQSVKVEDSVLE